jgi:hypothetical protein
MKHMRLALLILFLCMNPSSFIRSHKLPSLATTKPEYNWSYWAIEFGLGANYLHLDFPGNPAAHTQHLEDGIAKQTYRLPLADFRIGIEKSWQISDKWTLAIDYACLTPAFAFGYLVSRQTRFNFGFHCPITLNNLKQLSSTTAQYSDGAIIADTSRTQGWHARNQFICISPRIGIDHFTSPNTMIRISFSYDWHKFHDYRTNAVVGSMHWPQVTIGIKRLF